MMKRKIRINKKIKEEKGITLVALVITVVIMLILAGVAISAIVVGEGLFSKAKEAAETYKDTAQDEANKIQSMVNQINNYIEDSVIVNEPAEIGIIVTKNQTYDGGIEGTITIQ